MQVAIASRRLPVLESAASEIKAATGGTVLPVQVFQCFADMLVLCGLFLRLYVWCGRLFVCILPLQCKLQLEALSLLFRFDCHTCLMLLWLDKSNVVGLKTINITWLLIKWLLLQLDIRDPEAVKLAVDKIEQELGLPTVVKAHYKQHRRLISSLLPPKFT